MYFNAWGRGYGPWAGYGRFQPRGYLAAGLGYPYQGGWGCPGWGYGYGCGYGYGGYGYGYGGGLL